MIKTLNFVKEKLPFLIIISMVFGLIMGYYLKVDFLKGLVNSILFLMIYPMMITMKITDLADGFKNPKPLIISILLNFVLSPILAYFLGNSFFKDEPMLLVGIMMIALIPTSGMTASWTGIANGNMKSSLVMISANLLISIVMIPIYMKLLLRQVITIDTLVIVKSLVQVVIIPLVLGDITRRFIINKKGKEYYKSIKPLFGNISSVGVIIIVFVAMALKSKTIVNESQLVIYSLIPLIIYYGILFFTTHFIGKKLLCKENNISLVYGTTMRNLTIALGLSLSTFGGSLTVFLIAIGYAIQVPMAALYMRVVTR